MFEFEAIGFEKLSGPPKLDDSLPLIQTESNIKPTAVPDASYCYYTQSTVDPNFRVLTNQSKIQVG